MSGQPISDIQEAALYWSQNGVDQCTNVSDPCDPGVDYNQCLKYPEATFLWYAITYLSDYIVEMMSGVQNCDVLGLNWADDKIGQFYTLPFNPDSDIEPISIAGGIFAALSTVIPPAAIGAGAASMLNGVLTEAGLNAIDPLAQISEINSALGNFTNTTVDILGNYWDSMLGSSPELSTPLATNATALPAVLKGGGFAAKVPTQWYPPAVCGALNSVGINAMWNLDTVFIVKISDATLGQGTGAACNGKAQQGLLANNCGADGDAYIFIRWKLANFAVPWKTGEVVAPEWNLDDGNWQVWGAYSSAPNNPSGNTDNLVQYGLDLNTIALSSLRVQEKLGFWAQDTLGLLQTTVDNNLEQTLGSSSLQAWNVAVCDLDAFAAGKHLDPSLGDGWMSYIACTCLQITDQNNKTWPLQMPNFSKFTPNDCNKVWVS